MSAIVKFFSERKLLFTLWLTPLVFFYLPLFIYCQSQLRADYLVLTHLHFIANAYLPTGLASWELYEYFKSHGNLDALYTSVIGWPGGPHRSESVVYEAQNMYSTGVLIFLIIEVAVVAISLVIFKYQKVKFSKFLEKLYGFILTLNDRFRTFFQILCSLNFAICFFAMGQARSIVNELRTEVFSYLDMHYLPLNETSNRFWIIWMHGWDLFSCYWLFYVSFFSSISLLIAILFSDTEIIPKKARIPFILLKALSLLLFLIQILEFLTIPPRH